MNPDYVGNHETLGHCIFSSGQAEKERIPHTIIMKAINYNQAGQMSVDRMDDADMGILCAVHDDEASARAGNNRRFYGWYVFPAAVVRSNRFEATPSPSTDPRNVWHADVIMPGYSGEPEAQSRLEVFAIKVRAVSKWRIKSLNPLAMGQVEDAIQE